MIDINRLESLGYHWGQPWLMDEDRAMVLSPTDINRKQYLWLLTGEYWNAEIAEWEDSIPAEWDEIHKARHVLGTWRAPRQS
jgi:hypothetical protein